MADDHGARSPRPGRAPVSRWSSGWPAPPARPAGAGGRRPRRGRRPPAARAGRPAGAPGRPGPRGLSPPALVTTLMPRSTQVPEHLLHLGQEGVGPAPGRVALAALPQDEHGQLGQPVAGEDVDGPALDHLAGGRQAVTVEARAVGDPQRSVTTPHRRVVGAVRRRRRRPRPPPGPGPSRPGRPRPRRPRRTVPGDGGVDGVLHLHGLQDDQDLAGLDPVALGHRHPDHAAGHGGQRRPSDSCVPGRPGSRSSSTSGDDPSGPST